MKKIKRKIRVEEDDQEVVFGAETKLNPVDDNPQQPESQENNLPSTNNPYTIEDVDQMEPDEILNLVYFNIPDNLDISVKNRLAQRADEVRRQRESGQIPQHSAEDIAKKVIADAQLMLQRNR